MAEQQNVSGGGEEQTGFADDPIVFTGTEKELESYNKKMGEASKGDGQPDPDKPIADGSQSAPGVAEGEEGQSPPGTPLEGTPEATPEATPTGEPEPPVDPEAHAAEPETPAAPETPGLSDDEYFRSLSESTGLEIADDDSIVSTIKTLREENESLKEKAPEMPDDMSSLLQQAYEYEKKGGDVRTFLSIVNQDTQHMSTKEVLRQQFFNENPEFVKINPEYANQKFERVFSDKYGIVDENKTEEDFDDSIDYLKWQDDKKFAESEMDFASKKAIITIEDMKKKIVEEEPQTKPSEPAIDEEALQKAQEVYLTEVNKFKADFEAIEMPLDTEGKHGFNIGLNNATRPLFEQWVDNPPEFFEYIGISKDGKTINVETFGAHVALTAAMSATGDTGIGTKLVSFILENFNKETLESKLENPAEPAPSGGAQAKQMTDEEEAIKEFSKEAGGPYKSFYYPAKE